MSVIWTKKYSQVSQCKVEFPHGVWNETGNWYEEYYGVNGGPGGFDGQTVTLEDCAKWVAASGNYHAFFYVTGDHPKNTGVV